MSEKTEVAKALVEGGIGAIRSSLEAGRVRPRDLAEASLAAMEAGAELNAVVEPLPQALTEAAETAEAGGPLAGVPVLVKDCFVDRDRAPSVGSRASARWMSGTAEVLKRLRGAGAVVMGYTNLHEWTVGTTSLVSAFGPVRNPLDGSLIAGGSSGGSAAALAAGFVPLSIGSDVGGSIRIPAACCGVVGLKPTWGLVPTAGFVDHGSPIDHVGPMARSVEDVVALLETLAGTAVNLPDPARIRVGLARSYFLENVDPDVGTAVEHVVERLEPHVAEVRDVVVEGVDEARVAVAAFILRDVALMLSADGPDRQELLQPQTSLVVSMGAAMTEADRARAESVRRRMRSSWDRAFEDVDVIVTPTLPGRIATVADRTVSLPSGISSAEIEYVAWNGPMNLGGVPCLSLPCASLPGGQTFSVSLTSARGHDPIALALGLLLQSLA